MLSLLHIVFSFFVFAPEVLSFAPLEANNRNHPGSTVAGRVVCHAEADRRAFLGRTTAAITTVTAGCAAFVWNVPAAQAVGPVKIDLTNPVIVEAKPCPKERPIPGQMAMKGMKGLCVTVDADLADSSPKELEKVGVYGFVTDGESGDSVLANNPDLSTDAGQFAIVERITPQDNKIQFEFVAAVDPNKDLAQFENGIGPLNFESLRIISYPGGQQYGAISPCEMNEFSAECEEWEEANGPYVKGDFMMKSNPRTKGR